MSVFARTLLHLSIGLALAASAGLSGAQDAAIPGAVPIVAVPVVAVVRVPKPWYAPKTVVAGKMRDTIADYVQLPGLLFKAYSFERESGDFGGLYYWRDRRGAEAWFSPAWFERVRKERGAEGSVRLFEAPVSIDNTPGGTAPDEHSQTVSTLVEIAVPAGLTRERLAAEFAAAVPTYQKVPGLLRKHFILSAKGTFGGIYIWRDEASARAWFNPAWHQRVQATYGQQAVIEWFDTPILLPTRNRGNPLPLSNLIVAAP